MGGKHKQAQRTKNNARPSSSGRSAELLVGFSGKEAGFKLPGFSLCPSTTEDIDSSLNPNVQLVLKKMNKKDATTKLKALQEFAELIKCADEETVKSVLSYWPRMYCNLSTDVEHRVREATHLAHHALVLKAKRNLAPFLKQLAGPWFTSQYDTYAPAASAAEQAFRNAFPPNKVHEAIIFCQEEILTYIYDNAVVHTAQTLSNPKTTSPEDAEAKYQRVLIASLQGYSLYLNKVPAEQITLAQETNSKIVSSAKFWKLSKHKVPAIRAAWFSVLTMLCQKASFLLEREGEHVTAAIMINLDENEPMVLPYVWECALLLNTTIKEWWQFINVEKVVLPKLWKTLREGGQGNATVIYPNLLPLISHFPPMQDVALFYKSYFDNLRLGLKHKTVMVSRSEASAIATSFVECLRYIILKHQTDTKMCEDLIKNQLIEVIEWCLFEEHIAEKTLFAQTATLLQYWSRNRNDPDHAPYARYIALVWDNSETILIKGLRSTELHHEMEILGKIGGRQIEFLLALQRITVVHSKKHMKVKFAFVEATESGDCTVDSSTIECTDELYLNEMKSLVYKTCTAFVNVIDELRCKELLVHLYSLVLDFDDVTLFEHLNKQYSGDGKGNLLNIYNKLLTRWLNSTILCSQSVVGLAFLLFKYLNDIEKETMLELFLKQKSNESLSWCIARAMVHPFNEDERVQRWLSHPKISEFLQFIARAQLDDTSSADHTLLLKQAFTENRYGKLFISKDACVKIVSIFNEALLNPSKYPVTIDTCASFAAYISATLYTESTKLSYGNDLLLALFTLTCNTTVDPETLSQDTIWEVNTAWQDAISIVASEIPKNEFNHLVVRFADILQNELLIKQCDSTIFDHISKVLVDFLKAAVQKYDIESISELLVLIVQRPECISMWKQALVDVCVAAEISIGNLSSPWILPVPETLQFDDKIVVNYFLGSHLCVNVLTLLRFEKEVSHCEDENEDDSDFESEVSECTIKYTTGDIDNMIVDVLHSCAVAKSFINNYKNTHFYADVERQYDSIIAKLARLLESLHHDSVDKIINVLEEKVYDDSWMYTNALYILHSELLKTDLCDVYKKLTTKLREKKQSLSRIHLTQMFAEHISFDTISCTPIGVEKLIILRSLMRCENIEVQIAEALKTVENYKKSNPKLLFHETDISGASWEEAQYLIEIIRLFSAIVNVKRDDIGGKDWDFIIVNAAAWISSIPKSTTTFTIQSSSFIIAVSQLYSALFDYVTECAEKNSPNSIITEWNDLFVEDVHVQVIQTWMHFAVSYEFQVPFIQLLFLKHFGKITRKLDYNQIFKSDKGDMTKWTVLVPLCCQLMTCNTYTFQLWGYHMLMGLIPNLISLDVSAITSSVPNVDGFIFEQFKEILVKTEDIVETMLIDFKLGDSSCVEPFTDAYTYTLGYLCIWNVLLKFCEQASTELCFQYADWLKNGNYLTKLLNNIFRLMPAEILHHADGKSKPLSELFTNKSTLEFDALCSSELLEHLTCQVYVGCVEQLPALVRQWWSDTDSRMAQIVDRVTTAYVSPQLCNQELAYIGQYQTKFRNMVIKVHQSVREVVAIYTVDEAQMELVITLPSNYPLGGPNVECIRQIGGTFCRQWLMQLKMCMLHQNSRICDGLSLWNTNLNKKFDGVEECYICFSVLHPGTYQLPKLSCKTCRKKFHSACLYKWFSTSNKSTCPICRNLF